MILILTTSEDSVANTVTEWLVSFGVKFLRINSDKIKDLKFEVVFSGIERDIQFQYQAQKWKFSAFNKVWFRRGFFKFNISPFATFTNNLKINASINLHLENEITTLKSFLYQEISSGKDVVINSPLVYNFNKLQGLQLAQECGFNVPETLVTNKKEDIILFFEKHQNIITKNIQDVFHYKEDDIFLGHSTQQVTINDMEEFPDTFYYSCFQEMIPKKYELRVFYFLDMVYAVAIFSQQNAYSKIDGRTLHDENGKLNRIVPYQLNKVELKMIERFAEKGKLNSGSFDFIVTPSDKLYFLEVNPVGQFEYVSKRGNFHIEKEIAEKFVL